MRNGFKSIAVSYITFIFTKADVASILANTVTR
jgi:hypothetical protein